MKKQPSCTGLWQDAAAQKRWLRRFFLLAAVLLLPAVILAFYARPSADDYVYAARTHAVVQQYGLDLPRLLAAAWDTNVYYFHNWQGLAMALRGQQISDFPLCNKSFNLSYCGFDL